MVDPKASGSDFWNLLFSASGVTIAICITIVIIALIVFLLSRRYPHIAIQYGASRLELRRESGPIPAEMPETGAVSDLAEADKNLTETMAIAGPANDDVHLRLLEAIDNQDRSEIEDIFETFKTKPIFGGHFPYTLEVWKNMELLRAGFSDARTELERIEKENPKESDASLALSRYYLGIGAGEQALPHVEILMTRSDSDKKLASASLVKAEYIEGNEGVDAAIRFLILQTKKIPELEFQSRIYEELGDKYKKSGRNGLAISAYEKALNCDVHNKGARFQLAYLYGDIEALQSLSVRHYRILLRQDPKYWSAENNLGVQYQKLGLNYQKIQSWQAALNHNDGYALGNLMFAYLQTGFVERAERLYQDAPSYLKAQPRVVAAYTRTREIRDQEGKKLDEIREGGEAIWRELSKHEISLEVPAEEWIGEWVATGAEATLKISRSGEFFEIEEAEGENRRKGRMAKAPEGLAVVSVSQRAKEGGLATILTMGGSYGDFLICSVERGLKVIHIDENKLISVRMYTRVN